MSSEAKQYAARNRQGSSWFTHDSAVDVASSSADKSCSSEGKSDSSKDFGTSTQAPDRVQMIKPASNSNDWYKYDNVESPAKSCDNKQEKITSVEIEVTSQDVSPKNDEPIAVSPSNVDTDANQNLQRNKASETGSWFNHDNNPDTADAAVRQHGMSKELNANAARMRGDSANWFTHDHSSEKQVTTAQCSKGRQYKQTTDNMHGIFHHGSE